MLEPCCCHAHTLLPMLCTPALFTRSRVHTLVCTHSVHAPGCPSKPRTASRAAHPQMNAYPRTNTRACVYMYMARHVHVRTRLSSSARAPPEPWRCARRLHRLMRAYVLTRAQPAPPGPWRCARRLHRLMRAYVLMYLLELSQRLLGPGDARGGYVGRDALLLDAT